MKLAGLTSKKEVTSSRPCELETWRALTRVGVEGGLTDCGRAWLTGSGLQNVASGMWLAGHGLQDVAYRMWLTECGVQGCY